MLTEDELVEAMGKERHRTLKVWRDAVALAREMKAASGLREGDAALGS